MNRKAAYGIKKAILYILRVISMLLAVSIISFLLVLSSPNDPVESFMGTAVTEEQRAVVEEKWGLDQPPVRRYIKWLNNFIHGDMGVSMVYRQPVKQVILQRVSATFSLMGTAWLISGVLGFLLGIAAGAGQGSLADRIISRFCLLMSSAPVFWVGLLLLMCFSVKLKWFPIGLSAPIGKLASDVTLGDRIYHLVLPAFTLGITSIAKITLHTREKMIDIINSDFMLYAQARGEKKWTAVRRHAVRNIALPAVTLQFASLSELFSGSVLAEQVFSYPGLGNAATTAGLNGDANMLLGVVVISALIIFAGNAIADLLYGIFNPQIKEVLHERS